jgi:MFS family permease
MFYMATYATTTLHMSPTAGFTSLAIGSLCGMCLEPVSGWLSDRFGRRPIMLSAWTLLLIAIFPMFVLLSQLRTPAILFLNTAILGSFLVLGNAPILTSLGEALPKRMRSGVLAIIYAAAVSVFGGTTQFVVAWLITVTGSPIVPAWYMAIAVAIALACMMMLSETAPRFSAKTSPI